MTFLTKLKLIFNTGCHILIGTFAPDTDSLSGLETRILEASFSSNKFKLSPAFNVSSKACSCFSRFLIEVCVPLDCRGLIKASIHDVKFSFSTFCFAFLKDPMPAPDTFFSLSSIFPRKYLFLSFSHSFSTKSTKTEQKLSVNKKRLRPKIILDADLGNVAISDNSGRLDSFKYCHKELHLSCFQK